MRRKLLVLGLGITFLIFMTWFGTIITTIVPHRPTAQVQTVQAGPYQVTLQVNPNPPLITQPATLSLQILLTDSQQPISNARVTLESNMEAMDMGLDRATARHQSKGIYLAHIQFSMSGLWKIRVIVAPPGVTPIDAMFEVTAQ